MMNSPLVSVLMTSYNREKYIAEAIESVLASTFEDFELIIVDDGSKDRTVEIARNYETDSRVRVHINGKNLRDYANRNRAAELATGKYLKYVDSDDIIYPHGLQVMFDAMERFPNAGLGLCCPQNADKPYPFLLSPEEVYKEHFFRSGILNRSPLSAILRTEDFRDVGGFCTTEGPRGDFEMWLRMARKSPVVQLPAGLGWWRAHEGQETRYRLSVMVEDVSHLYILTMTALIHPHCPLTGEDREKAVRLIQRRHARYILRLSKSSPQSAHALRRGSKMSLGDLSKAFARP